MDQLNKQKKEEEQADAKAAAGIPEPQEKTVSLHPGTKPPKRSVWGKGKNRRSKKNKKGAGSSPLTR